MKRIFGALFFLAILLMALPPKATQAQDVPPTAVTAWRKDIFITNGGSAYPFSAMQVDQEGNLLLKHAYSASRFRASDGVNLWANTQIQGATWPWLTGPILLDNNGQAYLFDRISPSVFAKVRVSDGTIAWQIPLSMGDGISQGVTDATGNLIALKGFWNGGVNPENGIVKYRASDGATLWEKRDTPAGSPGRIDQYLIVEERKSILLHPSGDVIVCGVDYDTNPENSNWVIQRYRASDGAMLWRTTEKVIAAGGNDIPYSFTIDTAGDITVTGIYHPNTFTSTNWFTAKYRGSDGHKLWSQTEQGTSTLNAVDEPTAIENTPNGNVVVTGYVTSGQRYAWRTVCYRGTDGGELWQRDEPCGEYDHLRKFLMDTDGNPVAAGRDVEGATSGIRVRKYRASDGVVLWNRFETGTFSTDRNNVGVTAFLKGEAGTLVVVGFVGNSSTGADWRTLKLRSNNGTILWRVEESSSNLLSQYNEKPWVATVNAAGDVFVAGLVYNSTSGYHRLVKYAADIPRLHPIGAVLGTDNKRLALWATPSNRLRLIRTSATGVGESVVNAVPPSGGYAATAMALGLDGKTYILWRKNRSAIVWRINTSFTAIEQVSTFTATAAEGDVSPRDISIDALGKIWIAWNNANGEILLWKLYSQATGVETKKWYTPPTNTQFTALTAGGDNKPRLLLGGRNPAANTNHLWTLNSSLSALEKNWLLGPYGTTLPARDCAMGNSAGDLRVRVLFASEGNPARLLRLSPSGTIEAQWNLPLPVPGAQAMTLSLPNNQHSLVLWKRADGKVTIRLYDGSTGTLLDSDTYTAQ